ncbi:MAG: hypothetical protein PHX20_05880 [Candidatus Omnitrophica bacterium]|nr:hypothetical protein [Candidatus Omnitrophota bacterium]MDD5437055.1 hypothetical protein [Candidatus Omnitrophota bacterium]
MPNIFAKCCCCAGMICLYCVQLTLTVIVVIAGALVAWKPQKAIKIQIAFYRFINWKMEPVSMEKEIRNTRMMGATLIVVGIITFAYITCFLK